MAVQHCTRNVGKKSGRTEKKKLKALRKELDELRKEVAELSALAANIRDGKTEPSDNRKEETVQ